MNKDIEDQLKNIGASALAKLTAEAISTFNKELKVPRRLKKELTRDFALVVMSYYYQIEVTEEFVSEETTEDEDDEI